MAPRLDLQTLLVGALGSPNVYFQPPPNLQMVYPCIVYALDNAKKDYAGNKTYSYTDRYLVTVIARDPDIPVRGVIARLPMCTFSRAYSADNLHHYAYSLYF